MRIVSYNILDGGEGRADPLAEVIEAQRPDVVALIEADDIAVIERIANRMKMDWIQAKGQNHACALLTRWAIVDSINHAALRPVIGNSLLEATVRDPEGRLWPIGVVHLTGRDTEESRRQREQELAAMLEIFSPHRAANRAHLLAGDFNSSIDSSIHQRMLSNGYVDLLNELKPEYARNTGTYTTQDPTRRFDYLFAFGMARNGLKDAWIEQDRLAKFASDHFPVVVEII